MDRFLVCLQVVRPSRVMSTVRRITHSRTIDKLKTRTSRSCSLTTKTARSGRRSITNSASDNGSPCLIGSAFRSRSISYDASVTYWLSPAASQIVPEIVSADLSQTTVQPLIDCR